MHYYAKIKHKDDSWQVEFPDCPGCLTFGDTKEEAIAMAHEALEAWLESHFERGNIPAAPKATTGYPIAVPTGLSCAMQLRRARLQRGLTQSGLAKLAGVSQQQVAKLEQVDANPTVQTLARVAAALNLSLDVAILEQAVPGKRSGASRKATSTSGAS